MIPTLLTLLIIPYIAAQGEMGPGMLIIHEPDEPIVQQEGGFSQSLQLHLGWNLVSWHLDLTSLFGTEIEFQEILPDDDDHTWFHDPGMQGTKGELYIHTEDQLYYPDPLGLSGETEWKLPDAYYIHLEEPHTWDEFTECPQVSLGQPAGDMDPSDAWDDAEYGNWQDPDYELYGNYWFFLGYPVPGYTKLSSVYDPAVSGDPEDCDYVGPFHELVWMQDPDPPYEWVLRSEQTGEQYLTIVMTDDGRYYLPYFPRGHINEEIDQIGVLEPGRGYFLGFYDSGDIDYPDWTGYPGAGWESVQGDPKSTQKDIASSTHFQYTKYTHWSYPVVIDTVAIEGVELESGDEFGIFTPSGLCVGASVFQGEFPMVIATWKDDKATPLIVDGYTDNDVMTIILYDACANEEITLDLGPQTQSAVVENTVASQSGRFGQGSFAIKSLIYGIKEITCLPKEFKIGQNYPNPFNSTTILPLELPQRSKVKLEIFNVKGQRLGLPYERIYDPGWPKIRWSASKLPSGVYFYRITAEGLEKGGKFTDVGKMLLLK